jgi:hypothetical protein
MSKCRLTFATSFFLHRAQVIKVRTLLPGAMMLNCGTYVLLLAMQLNRVLVVKIAFASLPRLTYSCSTWTGNLVGEDQPLSSDDVAAGVYARYSVEGPVRLRIFSRHSPGGDGNGIAPAPYISAMFLD